MTAVSESAEQVEHTTVLLQEAVEALVTDPDGFYVDGTFGRGGHTAELLARLSGRGRVLAIDKDPQAIASGEERFAQDDRLGFFHGSFAELQNVAAQMEKAGEISGVLLDLGVSSPQLDQADRGFSFMRDGPLDMRMDTSRGLSAAEWIASADEQEIARVIKEYGEERFARRMASAVIRERAIKPITGTVQLAKILAAAHPAWERGRHPATKAFQGIRIFINRELDDLEDLLAQVIDTLKVGGRLVIISFHSLEDRRVKRFIRDQEQGIKLPKNLPVRDVDRGVRLVKVGKAIKPAVSEVDGNVRSRSAVMRIAERVA
ncbi:16S rRNA (cytosine(1402)-N(4))-methyltransferase RsmH [SAR92 clade bacterium H231]|jgi:16S rRNA (cytosine1402-N4)-methyltransferase|nr:16S rRNA (cytosine(1402)-N(4))-methyltransferase RsmH [Porticoccaceae bacterium]MCT2531662.1 16S rRNA (cytosine(1402)-N(4))-methyltransferase RsmH [SAR92 clade bacterium H231]MBT7259480.1 16S rRNA (cytosine(1402)-N(4))-methyltransferase RsmH [Porticoccaceae bacterium]MBT7904726.1 16S rRNA (cytosine(1402)-N(4))-methyltransferase RsmH [Porticoccaceae bacterium]MDA8735527.1 16S rRNA (cytosine(1402)-N(4))-methyltransferase RsmH [Porticoccaceae bacterium]